MVVFTKIKCNFFLLAVFFQLCSGGLSAQENSGKYTLEQVLNYAAEHNYGIVNAKLDVDIARKKVMEVTTLGLPQVNGELNFQNFLSIPTQVLPANAFNPQADPNELIPIKFGTNYNAVAGITATQLLFDGAFIVGLQASKTYAQLSQNQLLKNQNDLKADIAQAYYTAVVAGENVKILQKSIENTEKLLSETTQIYKSGFIEESDLDQINLLVLNLKNSLSRSERQLDLSLGLLKLQMGMEIEQPISLAENLDDILVKLDVETLYAKEFQAKNHIEYQLLMTRQSLMQLNLKKERYAYLPSLGAFISHQQNAFRNEFTFFQDKPWYPTTVWGINIKVPIFDSGMKYSKIKQARIEFEKTEVMTKLTEQSLKLQAQSSKADLISAYERLITERQNLVLAEKIQNKTLIKYQEGLASSLDLNQVQTQYLATQGNYINTVFEVLHSKARFDKAMNFK